MYETIVKLKTIDNEVKKMVTKSEKIANFLAFLYNAKVYGHSSNSLELIGNNGTIGMYFYKAEFNKREVFADNLEYRCNKCNVPLTYSVTNSMILNCKNKKVSLISQSNCENCLSRVIFEQSRLGLLKRLKDECFDNNEIIFGMWYAFSLQDCKELGLIDVNFNSETVNVSEDIKFKIIEIIGIFFHSE